MLNKQYAFIFLTFMPLTSLATEFTLNTNCPPNFELLKDNTCALRTLYDFYDSPPQHGGLKATLPKESIRFSPQQMDLGRFLFFDPILSVNKDMSCASCHQVDKGFSDGRKRSLGHIKNGIRQELSRSTPTLWNVSFLRQLMWDGRASSLIQQAALPLLATEEMGNSREGVVQAIRSNRKYVKLFKSAFNDKPSFENISIALAAFQTTLISLNSRYDRYAHGDSKSLTEIEIRGHNTFRGFVARCSQCHTPPLFTDNELAVIGAPANDLGYTDPGAGIHNRDVFLQGAFRVPTLRNITKTAPYFHSGQFKGLKNVIDFYNNTRGHASSGLLNEKIHWHIHMTDGPKLSPENVIEIVAFLGTLEDEKNLPKIPIHLPSGLDLVPSLPPTSN